jgi:hypothetical protein
MTFANTTAEFTVTVLVTVDGGPNALLTVNVTLQVPDLATVRDVVCPAAGVTQPAVPAPDGRLHVKVRGASPVAVPLREMLLVTMLLIFVCVAKAVLPLTVKLMVDAGGLKFALAAPCPGAAAMTMRLSATLDAMVEAMS